TCRCTSGRRRARAWSWRPTSSRARTSARRSPPPAASTASCRASCSGRGTSPPSGTSCSPTPPGGCSGCERGRSQECPRRAGVEDGMSSPLLTRPGAVPAGGPDEGVAAHYGDPVAEQRALERGIGVTDLSHLGVAAVTGPDRLTWLHSLASQQLADLAPLVPTEMLLLDPQGHVQHAAAVLDDGTTTWLVTERDGVGPLVAFLDSMRFMLRVEVREADELAVLGTHGDGPGLRLPDGHEPLRWLDPWPRVADSSTAYGPTTGHPGEQRSAAWWLVPRDRLEAGVDAATAAGARLAGVWAWEALRVAAWRPRLAREVDERTLPHELDWLRTAVHLTKGCYRGQETVAKLFNLGKPPRRLVALHIDGSDHL